MDDILKQQIKGVFSDFLKLVAKYAKANEKDCQAMICSDKQGFPVLYGRNPESFIIKDGEVMKFELSKIVGTTMMATLNLFKVDLNARISNIIKRICEEKKMSFNEFNLRITCEDEFARKLDIYLCSFDDQKEKLEWDYVLKDI